MVFPIPFDGLKNFEIDRVNARCMAETERLFAQNRVNALFHFYSGGLVSIEDLSREEALQKSRTMPFKNLEYASIQLLLLMNDDDGVDGYYECPRCQTPLICSEENGNLDHINDLDCEFLDNGDLITIELEEPIETSKETVSSISFCYPTVKTLMNNANAQNFSLRVMANSVKQINGSEEGVTGGIITTLGDMKNVKDIRNISDVLSKGGYDFNLKKICQNCGNEWKVLINTKTFFTFS